MKSVYCGIHEINSITLQNFPILKGLMPHSITLSPIKGEQMLYEVSIMDILCKTN